MLEREDDMLLGARGESLAARSSHGHTYSIPQELFRACAAELIATMLFVLLGVTAVRNNIHFHDFDPPYIDILGIALAHGLLIFVLVAMTANVSGGHINPAVSLGVWMAGEISFVRFILYFLAQLVGASIGGALALGLNGHTAMESIAYGTHHPSVGYSKEQAMGVEIFTTCIVVSTVLANAVDSKGFKVITPLCIGLAVAAGILVSGNITGGSMNPARSFGPAVASLNALNDDDLSGHSYRDLFWNDQWIYFVGPLLGGAVAAVNYRFLLSSHPLKRVYVHDLTSYHMVNHDI